MSDKEKNGTAPEPEDKANVAVATEESKESEAEEAFKFDKDPEFDLDYKGECLYEVKVTVFPEDQKKQAEKMFDELKHEAEVPGFRKGKAPLKLIENKFRKVVRGEVRDKLVNESFRKLVKDKELRPIASPDVDGLDEAGDQDESEPISFSLKFEVAPRCELGQYRGIKIEKPVLKVGDAEVNSALEDLRARFSVYEPLDKGSEAKDGDQAIVDFEGKIDGEVFSGGKAENYPYILGSSRFFPEFEEALNGTKAGQEVTCEVTFPEDYSNKGIAGKTAEFTIRTNELKRKRTPDLDDELAKQAGFDSLEAMKEKVAGDMRAGAEERSGEIAERNAIAAVVGNSSFELPKSLVESSAKEYYEQELRRLMALRVPASELKARDDELRKEAEQNAIRNIKAFVIINEIGEVEGIEVKEEDFEKEAESIRQRTGMDMDVVSRFLQQDEQRDNYESRIFRQKAIAIVLENADVTEIEVTREELDGENEQSES